MTDNAQPNGHDRFLEWDAAYVLGALSSAERREFEAHLSQCKRCADAVSMLAGMPGLLGTLEAQEAFAILEADAPGSRPAAIVDGAPAPADILTGLTARVRQRRRARAWTVGFVSAAAAAAIAAAVVLPMSLGTAAPPPPTLAATLSPVNPAAPGSSAAGRITASIQLTSVKWGTKIAVSCSYAATPSTGGAGYGYTNDYGRYGLYITDKDGKTNEVSSWRAWPGSTVNTAGSTEMREADIARIELRSLDTGAVLLSRVLS
jgi:anti-sigma factor RsiW